MQPSPPGLLVQSVPVVVVLDGVVLDGIVVDGVVVLEGVVLAGVVLTEGVVFKPTAEALSFVTLPAGVTAYHARLTP